MTAIPFKAKLFIYTTAAIGVLPVVYAVQHWHTQDGFRFVCYLLIAILASGLKVQLPGIDGTMSVNFLFILIGILELSFPETVLLGCAAALAQCLCSVKRRPGFDKILFNVLSMMSTAVTVSYLVYRAVAHVWNQTPVMLVAAACAYFLTNTIPVAMVISLTEAKPFRKIWSECYFWSFAYYLTGAAIAALVNIADHAFGWELSLLILPVVYWIYRSYRLYLSRLEAEKLHVEAIAGLHLRTIEALALAIEAKDQNTHAHLRRVRTYAEEIGRELNLDEAQLQALRAAALLHDIGKLAVPEHIINKPGRLTPEEFEKVKTHPLVGAEILERVNFPYPVVPIVRAHHECWDGSGYPFGLKGEEIPIGARILSVVDCLDALASDRQYRRALPLRDAMQQIEEQAGKHFDPNVVAILSRRYIELEKLAQMQNIELARLSTDLKILHGAQPAAGFEQSSSLPLSYGSEEGFLNSIAEARQEAQTLFELSHDLGNSLSLDETLSVLSVRLKKLIPYDAIAIYLLNGDRLVPEFVNGDNFRLFSSLEIPIGQGISGWVAQTRKPIVNGNPSVEPGYLDDPTKFSSLRSALSVPLEGLKGVVGALTLYKAEGNAFTKDHLRVLLAISSKVALSIENALRYRQAESSAVTDYLTGLPNARSLFLNLERELACCKNTDTPLSVIVCDLDGFKQINDRFGHLEGNNVLKTFANLLRAVFREYDCVARMGGDEFVVVAPHMTREVAERKIAHLNTLAKGAGMHVCGHKLLSLSVGTAFFPDDGTSPEQLLAEADRRMYIAKQANHKRAEVIALPVQVASTTAGHLT